MQSKEIRFKSCYICDVIINDKCIELIDSCHTSMFIDKSNNDVMQMFKDWFVDVYKACVPCTLTLVQYHIESNDGEPVIVVEKIIYKKNNEHVISVNASSTNSNGMNGNEQVLV